MKKAICRTIFLILSTYWNTAMFGQENIVIQGEKHHFTVSVPEEWTNDESYASQFGLPCFLYPEKDSTSDFSEYIYVIGIDKKSLSDSLSGFIKNDIEKFSSDNPDMHIIADTLQNIEGTSRTIQYTFSDLYDDHLEKVVYAETHSSFIVFSFASTSAENFKRYEPIFAQFFYSMKNVAD